MIYFDSSRTAVTFAIPMFILLAGERHACEELWYTKLICSYDIDVVLANLF